MMLPVQEANFVTAEDFERAPCLREGPISEAARGVVVAARGLGNDHRAAHMRCCCVLNLFENTERIFASGEEPVAAFNLTLEKLARLLNEAIDNDSNLELKGLTANGNGDKANGSGHLKAATPTVDVKEITGRHYGRLFQGFSNSSFWDEPFRLLRTRIERNGILISGLNEKRVLDAGCGGGRYSVAWRLLEAQNVIGLDASQIGISDAIRRIAEAKIDGVEFQQGNVLALPFPDNSFDVVFSNGVLHHTTDWQRGVSELVRVLKPGGLGWLYLIENPGGLFWDTVEILRVIMANEDRDNAREVLGFMGVPANRVFYMLDHVMVPINLRLTAEQIEQCLAEAGATGSRRLTRGADFDRVERIYQSDPYAELKYGAGENRHIFSKQ